MEENNSFDSSVKELEISKIFSEASCALLKRQNTEKFWIYKHMIVGPTFVQCTYCNTKYDSSKFHITTFTRHLLKHGVSATSTQANEDSSTDLLIDFIVSMNLPMTILENREFKMFIQRVSRDFKLPCRKTGSEYLLKHMSSMKVAVKRDLQHAHNVSLVLDCWTSSTLDHYVGFTVHWISEIDDRLSIEVRFLGAYFLRTAEEHTRPSTFFIKNRIREVLNDFEICDKLISIVTDKGSDVKCAIKELGFLHIWEPCIAHSMNRCFESTFEYGENRVWRKFQKMTRYCRKSIGFRNESVLRSIPRIPSFSYTRWGGVLKVMKVFFENQKSIEEALHAKKRSNLILGNNESETLKYVYETLYPIADYISELEQEIKPTLCYTSSCVYNILKQISDRLESSKDESKSILTRFKDGIEKRCTSQGNFSRRVVIAFFLHPQLKDIDELLPSFNPDEQSPFVFANENQLNTTDLVSVQEKKKAIFNLVLKEMSELQVDVRKNLHSTSSQVLSFASRLSGREAMSVRSPNEVELSMYCQENVDFELHNVLDYWNAKKYTYPTLFRLAKKYLAIPATSASIERCWSVATRTDTPQRRNMSTKVLSTRVFQKCFQFHQ